MGRKHKHSKDKLYKTVTELQSHHVGEDRDLELSKIHRRLRFDSCCLTLNTVTDKPMGLTDSTNFCYVFECNAIVKFLEKFNINPITGEKVKASELIELKFYKNDDGHYHCPVIYKLFNQNTKIVANKKTGNVYSYEAYQRLNVKTNHYKDLLSDEPFDKCDIVTIQDPDIIETKWNVTNFHYVKNNLKLDDDHGSTKVRNIEQSGILKSSLDEFKKRAEALAETHNRLFGPVEASKAVELDEFNSATYSDGRLARSVTSTVEPVTSGQSAALLSDEQILYPKVKKKGYVQIMTSMGPLNLELYCDRTPKTCHNFLLLASRGYYNNSCFHRLVKNFIIQGGDPTGTGSGGESAWKVPFDNECKGDLKHNGRGVIAMANSGPNTNKSQFYIVLKGQWEHLDGKHTVFGRVVGGEETLSRVEKVEVDKNDRPKQDIKILNIVKYVDPFQELEKEMDSERQKRQAEANNNKSLLTTSTLDESGRPLKKFRSGIGTYVNLAKLKEPVKAIEANEDGRQEKETLEQKLELSSRLASLNQSKSSFRGRANGNLKSKFGDFSDW